MQALRLEIECEIGKLCTDVYIYKSPRTMRAAIWRKHALDNPQGYALTAFDKGMERPAVYFCFPWASLDIAAHEFFHLGIEFGAMKFGPRGIYKNQEAVVTVASEFTRLFWNRYIGLDDDYCIAGTAKLFQDDFKKKRKP